MSAVVTAREVSKTFASGSDHVRALVGVDLDVALGEVVAIHGRSGSGKTTLLNAIGGLETIDSGSLEVCGVDVARAQARDLDRMRSDSVGFVFQNFALIEFLTARENVELPLRSRPISATERSERVDAMLDRVGLTDRGSHLPDELSGGEQQRVAMARALVIHPTLLIADEPTGQLDDVTAEAVLDALVGFVRDAGIAAIVATHDPIAIGLADSSVELRDGARC